MERAVRELADEIDSLVDRLGRLPEAPLAMPKQRLEAQHPAVGWFGRLIGRGAGPMGDARHSGQ